MPRVLFDQFEGDSIVKEFVEFFSARHPDVELKKEGKGVRVDEEEFSSRYFKSLVKKFMRSLNPEFRWKVVANGMGDFRVLAWPEEE